MTERFAKPPKVKQHSVLGENQNLLLLKFCHTALNLLIVPKSMTGVNMTTITFLMLGVYIKKTR